MSINDLSIYQKVDLLVSVDSDTFTLLCQTNKAFKEACSLENVYDQRCHKYFSDDILQLKYKYNMKWKEFYDRVTKFQKLLELRKIISLTVPEEWLPQLDIDVINNADAYAIEGKVFELELCLLMGEEPDVVYGANWAAGRGHLDVLRLLKEYNIIPNNDGFIIAAENGQTDILDWLEKEAIGKDEYEETVNLIADIDEIINLNTLKWFAQRKIYPDKNLIMDQFELTEPNFELLQWAFDNKIIKKKDFSKNVLKIINYTTRPKVYNWLKNNKLI